MADDNPSQDTSESLKNNFNDFLNRYNLLGKFLMGANNLRKKLGFTTDRWKSAITKLTIGAAIVWSPFNWKHGGAEEKYQALNVPEEKQTFFNKATFTFADSFIDITFDPVIDIFNGLSLRTTGTQIEMSEPDKKSDIIDYERARDSLNITPQIQPE